MRLFYFYICYMVDIQRVYQVLNDLCNKDQRGFVTQNEFNNFAVAAQQKIYNEIFQDMLAAQRLRRTSADAKGPFSLVNRKEEDLSNYLVQRDLLLLDEVDYGATQDPNNAVFGNLPDPNTESGLVEIDATVAQAYRKPIDLHQIVNIYLGEADNSPACELLRDPVKYKRMLNSRISAPTTDFPVAFVGDYINIHPTNDVRAVMLYYRQPRSRYASAVFVPDGQVDGEGAPTGVQYYAGDLDITSTPVLRAYGGTGLTAIDLPNSRNFDLPEHYMYEIIVEMAHMIGVNVRDAVLTQYGLKEAKEQ